MPVPAECVRVPVQSLWRYVCSDTGWTISDCLSRVLGLAASLSILSSLSQANMIANKPNVDLARIGQKVEAAEDMVGVCSPLSLAVHTAIAHLHLIYK